MGCAFLVDTYATGGGKTLGVGSMVAADDLNVRRHLRLAVAY